MYVPAYQLSFLIRHGWNRHLPRHIFYRHLLVLRHLPVKRRRYLKTFSPLAVSWQILSTKVTRRLADDFTTNLRDKTPGEPQRRNDGSEWRASTKGILRFWEFAQCVHSPAERRLPFFRFPPSYYTTVVYYVPKSNVFSYRFPAGGTGYRARQRDTAATSVRFRKRSKGHFHY